MILRLVYSAQSLTRDPKADSTRVAVRMQREALPMKKTLLFDLDGTLIDTYAVILASMRYTINEFAGKELGDTQLMSLVGTPLRDQMARFVSEERADELCAVYREHNDRIHDAAVSAFDGIPAALAALREAGCRMGIVTSKRHHMAVRGLEVCGIDGFFDVVVGSDDWPEHKPKPGSVIHGAQLMGEDPSQCLYIGDSPFDIQAGNAAGCTTVAATWGMFPEGQLRQERPALICSSPAELPALLS